MLSFAEGDSLGDSTGAGGASTEESPARAADQAADGDMQLRDFMRAVRPEWCGPRHDLDRVMRKLHKIGITSISELLAKVNTNAINVDLATAGHTTFRQETLEEIRRLRPSSNAVRVPYCRQIGSLSPAHSLLKRQVRNLGEDSCVIPIATQKAMSFGVDRAPSRPSTTPAPRRMSWQPPKSRTIPTTRSTAMAAVVRPARAPENVVEALIASPGKRSLRFSSKRVKPGCRTPDGMSETLPSIFHGSTASNSEDMRLGSRLVSSTPSLGGTAQSDRHFLGLPTPSSLASAMEDDCSGVEDEELDFFDMTLPLPGKAGMRPPVFSRNTSKTSLASMTTSGRHSADSPAYMTGQNLDDLMGTYARTVASMPKEPALALWAGINSRTVGLHSAAFLREQEALDAKRELVKAFSRPGSAMRYSVVKNVGAQVEREKGRDQWLKQDMSRRVGSIKNSLGLMQQSRRELNSICRKYESITTSRRLYEECPYDYLHDAYRATTQ